QEAVILEDETDLPVAERGERVRWELERIAPVERHTPGGRRLERAEDVEQRALAAPRRSHDRGRIARRHVERHAVEHAQRTARGGVVFREIGDLEHLSRSFRLIPPKGGSYTDSPFRLKAESTHLKLVHKPVVSAFRRNSPARNSA